MITCFGKRSQRNSFRLLFHFCNLVFFNTQMTKYRCIVYKTMLQFLRCMMSEVKLTNTYITVHTYINHSTLLLLNKSAFKTWMQDNNLLG
jgi:hypothetical protein